MVDNSSNSVKDDLEVLSMFIKLNRFDRSMVESLHRQLLQGIELTEKQVDAIEKIKYRYRNQISKFEEGRN